VVSSTPRPFFTSGKDPVPIVQEAGWAPGPVWTGGKSRPNGIRSPDRPARSQLLYRLRYLEHTSYFLRTNIFVFLLSLETLYNLKKEDPDTSEQIYNVNKKRHTLLALGRSSELKKDN
jgi:hypothetical protein